MPTIKDVANLAEVSATTVSRVLNNRGYITQEIRKKVEDAMVQLDYFPNQIARSLQNKQTFILGVIVPDLNNPLYAEIIKYVELIASEQNYKILLYNSLYEPEKEENYINMLKQNQVDGIIMCSHKIDVDAYERINIPIITFERVISKKYPYVSCDNYRGGELATEHLIESGCKRLLHISGPMDIDLLYNKRTDAFKSTCLKHQIQHTIIEGSYDNLIFENARTFVEDEVSDLLINFDGVFCMSDFIAYAVYNAAIEKGIKVPQELKIVGYDYHSFTRMIQSPKLTTIAQPMEKIGHVLSSTLIDMIENKEHHWVRNTMLEVELIKGDTT